MPKAAFSGKQTLSDDLIHNAPPKAKQYRLYDSDGLSILIAPSGGRWWRFKYRFDGKQKMISMGTFPKILLLKARILRDNARQLLKQGKDPSVVRKAEKAERKQTESVIMPAIRFLMDGTVELWKDRSVIHLSQDEAQFVANQLSALLRCCHGIN